MKIVPFLALVQLLSACSGEEPVMTFGLAVRLAASETPPPTRLLCSPPGEYASSVGVSLSLDGPPPHLFVESEAYPEDDVYRVRVYDAVEQEANRIVWIRNEVLFERTYDSAFGEGSLTDSFVVDFDGQQYTFEAQGLPASATCPFYPAP